MPDCISKEIVFPVAAELKCPRERREDTYESEAVAEVAYDGFRPSTLDIHGFILLLPVSSLPFPLGQNWGIVQSPV